MNQQIDPRTWTVRMVEEEGFKSGANAVPPDEALKEINASFARQQAEAREAAMPGIKQLEGRAATLQQMSNNAQTRWLVLRDRCGVNHPRLGMPLLLTALSLFALGAEAILLAPILDILGIADPVGQLCAAGAIVTIAALIFHHYLENRLADTPDRLAQILAFGTVAGLVVLGTMRSKQLSFSATLGANPLGNFLNNHPWLGGSLFVFFTLFFPIAAAVGLQKGMDRLSQWWEYRSASRLSSRLSLLAAGAQKLLEGETERLEHQLAQLGERAQEWKSAYCTYHRLGHEVGANRLPRWIVWAKATVFGLAAFVLAALVARQLFGSFNNFALALSLLTALAVWLVAAVRLYRRWQHPSPAQYLRQANLRFTNVEGAISANPAASMTPLHTPKILPVPHCGINSAREVN